MHEINHNCIFPITIAHPVSNTHKLPLPTLIALYYYPAFCNSISINFEGNKVPFMVLLYFGLYNIIDDFELLIRHWNGLDPLQWIGLLIASAELFLYRHANISSCWIYGIRLDCLLILYHPPVLWFPGFMLVWRVVPFFTPFRIVSNHCALFFSCACGFVMMAFLNFNCYDFTALLTLWLRLVHLGH